MPAVTVTLNEATFAQLKRIRDDFKRRGGKYSLSFDVSRLIDRKEKELTKRRGK